MEWLHAIDKKYASRKTIELNEIHDLIRNRLFTNAQPGVHIYERGVNKKTMPASTQPTQASLT